MASLSNQTDAVFSLPTRPVRRRGPPSTVAPARARWGPGARLRASAVEPSENSEARRRVPPSRPAEEAEPEANSEEQTELAEVLESLEEEVMAGEDEGREPLDYSRRAHLFHKSSQVFQARKERSTES